MLCGKVPHKFSIIKQQIFYLVHNFVRQEFRKGSAGWFSVEVTRLLLVRCELGQPHLKVQPGWTCMPGNPLKILAECLLCLLQHGGLRIGRLLPRQLASPNSEYSKTTRWKLDRLFWPGLESHITSLQPYFTGWNKDKQSQIQEEETETLYLSMRGMSRKFGPIF